jgi:ABC-type transport system involved in cytochrome c biogenesis ATPase subunit
VRGANGRGKESLANSLIGIREGRAGSAGYAAGREVASEVGGGPGGT